MAAIMASPLTLPQNESEVILDHFIGLRRVQMLKLFFHNFCPVVNSSRRIDGV
jgi:hypothetical protein